LRNYIALDHKEVEALQKASFAIKKQKINLLINPLSYIDSLLIGYNNKDVLNDVYAVYNNYIPGFIAHEVKFRNTEFINSASINDTSDDYGFKKSENKNVLQKIGLNTVSENFN